MIPSVKNVMQPRFIFNWRIMATLLWMFITVVLVQADNKLEPKIVEIFLSYHNKYRTNAGVGNLTWSDDLEAQAWKQVLDCNLRNVQARNTFNGGARPFDFERIAKNAVGNWANERTSEDFVHLYSFRLDKDCYNIDQLLWRNSTKLGCAIKNDCYRMPNFAVCVYDQHCVSAGEHVHKTRLMVLVSVPILSLLFQW
uniref:SCP domain-containing protein n=1 Tax=Biomphalaria glabrata TaxID=6526 RepID=A0A2C9KV16_BIOGL